MKWDPPLRIFLTKMGPMSKDFWWKSDPFGWHLPVCLNMWVPQEGLYNHTAKKKKKKKKTIFFFTFVLCITCFCFCFFLKNDVCVLMQIVWRTQNWFHNFSWPSGFRKIPIKTCKMCFCALSPIYQHCFEKIIFHAGGNCLQMRNSKMTLTFL